ncbi:MAG TPA: hypothetical protein VM536_22615 [Chloroflexia bacterium]|nr:hypothetical protein [Chloroflexia bacterium]
MSNVNVSDAEDWSDDLPVPEALRQSRVRMRPTQAGAIGTHVDEARQIAAMIELRCETDFACRTVEVRRLADDLARQVAVQAPTDQLSLLREAFIGDPKRLVKDVIRDLVTQLSENIQVGRLARLAAGAGSAGGIRIVDEDLNRDACIPALLAAVPELVPAYVEHMDDMTGELLPHVFMGDVVRFLFHAYRRSQGREAEGSAWREVATRILDFMERAGRSSDPYVDDLVSTGFVENLLPSDEADAVVFEAIRPILGPNLQRRLAGFLE